MVWLWQRTYNSDIEIMIKNVEWKWYMMMYNDGIEMIMILKKKILQWFWKREYYNDSEKENMI